MASKTNPRFLGFIIYHELNDDFLVGVHPTMLIRAWGGRPEEALRFDSISKCRKAANCAGACVVELWDIGKHYAVVRGGE